MKKKNGNILKLNSEDIPQRKEDNGNFIDFDCVTGHDVDCVFDMVSVMVNRWKTQSK